MTSHDAVVDRLSDYLDGEDLSPADRASIEAHVAACRECQTTLDELKAVAAYAGRLPDRGPDADLWPGVEARVRGTSRLLRFERGAERRFTFTLPQLVAAGLALMVLSGGMVWIARSGNPRASLPPVVAQVEAPEGGDAAAEMAPASFADSYYDQAVSDLEKTLAESRNRLDPETVRILEDNLASIDTAIEQSRKALRNDPANVYLNNHFAAYRNRKLALLRKATALATRPDNAGS
ncbi:MAG TPA: zf-HC2 domain-containing protein [Vicinamibacterales bacterium]|nr:zf-HC2 domain-containing protein [Vicinamibacterales bacterium]